MTVRITKPKFNLREKLSELDKPIGLKGNELMRSDTSQHARDLISADRKNMVINGSFQVAQRGTSLLRSGAQNIFGTVDRFEVNWFGGGFSGNHATESQWTDAPPGHSYSYKINTEIAQDFSNALGTWIIQKFEGNQLRQLKTKELGYKPFTVSYWVKSNKTGFTTLAVETAAGGDGSTGHSFSTAIPINNANTWEHKTFTFPASPPNQLSEAEFRSNANEFSLKFGRGSNGSWLVDTDDQWNLYSSNRGLLSAKQTNFCESVNDYIAIAGVQMEVGENATEFEYLTFGEELRLCQRYFSIYHPTTQEWIYFEGATNNHKWWQTYVPTGMRNEPSVTLKGSCSTNNFSASGGTISSMSVQAIDNGGNSGTTHPGSMGRVSYRVTFSGSHGNAYEVRHADGWGNGNGWVEYDSEL